MEILRWRDVTCALLTPLNHACMQCLYATQKKCVRKCACDTVCARRLQRIVIVCERNTLTLGLKEKSLFIPSWCLPPRRRLPPGRRFPPEEELADGFEVWLTWSLSNLLTGMASCASFAKLFKQSFFDTSGFLVIFRLIHGAVRTRSFKHTDRSVSTSGAPCRLWDRPQPHPRVRRVLRSIRCRCVNVDNEGFSRIYQIWIGTPFSPFRCYVSWVIDSLPLCVPPWRAPWDGPFLMT